MFATFILALLPAVYAWQLYDLVIGIVAFFVVAVLQSILSRIFLARFWPLRWIMPAKVVLTILLMVALGLSAAETCNQVTSECTRVF